METVGGEGREDKQFCQRCAMQSVLFQHSLIHSTFSFFFFFCFLLHPKHPAEQLAKKNNENGEKYIYIGNTKPQSKHGKEMRKAHQSHAY